MTTVLFVRSSGFPQSDAYLIVKPCGLVYVLVGEGEGLAVPTFDVQPDVSTEAISAAAISSNTLFLIIESPTL
jgi:hypothetical protein